MAKNSGKSRKRSGRPVPPTKPFRQALSFKRLVPWIVEHPEYGRQLHELVIYAREHAKDTNKDEYNWANREIHNHIRYANKDHSAVEDIQLSGDLDDGVSKSRCTNNTTHIHIDFAKYI